MTGQQKDILIISHFVDFPWEKGNDRFVYVAQMLAGQGQRVEIVTSDFIHNQKRHRRRGDFPKEPLGFKVTLLHEEGYKKNVCLKRLRSHKGLGSRLKSYLLKRKKPDVIYCAVPSLDLAWEASEYAVKNGIRFVVDIQDLWPEAFEMVLPFPVLGRFLFYRARRKADAVYSRADEIVAVSETYLARGRRVNKKNGKGLSVFLGTEFAAFDQYREIEGPIKPKEEVWLAYVGTLGHSYDLTEVIDALRRLNNPKLRFMVLGDGPLKERFQKQAEKAGILCTFTGRLPYPQMVSLLCHCDIAVNPIMKGAAQSIINKVGDYAAAGLPVVSTQECSEYRLLLDTYRCGFNCENGNIKELAYRLKLLSENQRLRGKMGKNNRKLGEERFDRASTYQRICCLLME